MSIARCGAGEHMPHTMRDSALTTQDRTIVSPRPTPAKAVLRDDNPLQARLSTVVMEAARQAHGKQEAAARELGKDPGNFSRDVKAGRTTLRDLADLGPEFLAHLGAELTLEFAANTTSVKARARQRIAELVKELLEATA